jgi:hypothetical protein
MHSYLYKKDLLLELIIFASEVTKIGTIRAPTSEMLSTWELWLSKRCSPLCQVSRTRCWLQCPQRRCVSESSPGVTSLADEDCSKDLIMDTYGADPTLYPPWLLAQTFSTTTFLRLRSPRRMLLTDLTSILAVLISSPLVSPSSVHSARNSALIQNVGVSSCM